MVSRLYGSMLSFVPVVAAIHFAIINAMFYQAIQQGGCD
jgi:hypothetical protein